MMTNAEIARRLRGLAKHSIMVNWQDNRMLLEAAARLDGLTGAKARLLTLDEVLGLEIGQVAWEECRGQGADGLGPCYPVMMDREGHLGDSMAYLSPAGIVRSAKRDEDGGQLRWWDRRPSAKQRRLTVWEEVKEDDGRKGAAPGAGLRDVPAEGDL